MVMHTCVMMTSDLGACHAVAPSLLLSSGPRCLASWSVWTRRTIILRVFVAALAVDIGSGICMAVFAGYDVFPYLSAGP